MLMSGENVRIVHGKARRWMATVGAMLVISIALGGTQVINAVVPFLIPSMNTTMADFMVGPAIGTVSAAVCAGFGVKVINYISPKIAILFGAVCAGIMLALAGVATHVYVYYASCFINGAVLGLASFPAAGAIIAEVQGERYAKVFGAMGAVQAFFASGWMALTTVLLSFFDYRTLFYAYAVFVIVAAFLLVVFLIGPVTGRIGTMSQAQTASEGDVAVSDGFAFGELLRMEPSLYLFLGGMVLIAFCSVGVTTYGTIFFTGFDMDPIAAAGMLTLFQFASAFLKFAAGFLSTKLGPRGMSVFVPVVYIVGILFLLGWGMTQLFPLAVLGIIMCAVISYTPMMPGLMTPSMYGMKDYTGISSAGLSAYYVGAVLMILGLSQVFSVWGPATAYAILAVVAVLVLRAFLGAAISIARNRASIAD